MIRVMLRQSRHSRSFSHFSTASPGAYRIDSCRETSCSVRAVPHKTHTHSEEQLVNTFCPQEQGKCSTLSLSHGAHKIWLKNLKRVVLNCSGGCSTCLDTNPKGISLSQCNQCPEMVTNRNLATRRPRSASHLVTGLLFLREKQLHLLGTQPLCLMVRRSVTALVVMRGRIPQESVK